MGVFQYAADGKKWWAVDLRYKRADGSYGRLKQKRIPTKEQALALEAKARKESFEGRFFDVRKAPKLTVLEAWELYKPAGAGNDSAQTDEGRAAHILRHLGQRSAVSLTVEDVEKYRAARRRELTVRKTPPTPATLDRELELLKRMLNYAVSAKKLESNPIKDAKFLRVPNVRRVIVGEEAFQRLYTAAEPELKPIVLVAFDTGMREREVLDLREEQVDRKGGRILLAPQDTKAEEPRVVVMTSRVKATIEAIPQGLPATALFRNPATSQPYSDISKVWARAMEAAGLQGTWFHDLRRSFVTKARKAGVPESVVMKMSGHRTRAVFDRYNVVEEEDLRAAVARIEQGAGVGPVLPPAN